MISAAVRSWRSLPILPVLGAVVVCLAPPSVAATHALTADGVLHAITVEPRQVDSSGTGGTRLVHSLVLPDDTIELRFIPGTDDAAFDVEPTLALNPATGFPSVAWSRQVGTSYEIFASSFDGAHWSPIRQVTVNTREDRNAQAVVNLQGYLHLIWTSGALSDSSPIFYEAILDLGGTIVLPAVPVHAALQGTVTEVESTASTILAGSRVLFAFNTSPKSGNRVSCFGGQDEPIPLDRRVDFVLESGSGPIENPRVTEVDGRIAVLFRSTSRLYYSIQSESGWSPIRSLSLFAMSEEQAEIVIRTMAAEQAAP